jgi:hypothetical protein
MRLRLILLGLAACSLLVSQGCISMGLWDSAGEVNDPTRARSVERARLTEDTLELIVYYDEEGSYRVRVDLAAETEGFHEGQPTLRGVIDGPHPQDLQPERIPVVEDHFFGEHPSEDDPGPPVVYWRESSFEGLVVCLRYPEAEAVFIRVPNQPPSGAAPLAYVGAALATPVTFALDVVTFPAQVIIFLVIMDEVADTFG